MPPALLDIVKDRVAIYHRLWEIECANEYPAIDDLEDRMGYGIDRDKIEEAARILACPFKANPPCWQHGRVIYSVLCNYLPKPAHQNYTLVDIGTAKGFSALCMRWAVADLEVPAEIFSLDVIDPNAAAQRNTVADIDGTKTLRQILAPWPESMRIKFLGTPSLTWLSSRTDRVNFAFVDGKHNYAAVSSECSHLARLQKSDDIIIFDDIQIDGVRKAVGEMQDYYSIEFIVASLNRQYAIATRK